MRPMIRTLLLCALSLSIVLMGPARVMDTAQTKASEISNDDNAHRGSNTTDALGVETTVTGVIAAGDWPQLQHDAQRTGYTPETINPPYQLAWYRNFQPERISNDVQAVVCAGKVFVPTQSGNLYALNATNGTELWKFAVGSPVLHTAACDADRVIVAAMDGGVYAVSTDTGERIWRFEAEGHTGFSSAPVVAENAVFIGERGGIFYAIDLANGAKKWSIDVGTPIFNTAAYNLYNGTGRVYFCDEALYVHALNSQTGAEIWKSPKLYGQSCKQYHPVVYNGFVMVRPMMTHAVGNTDPGIDPFTRSWDQGEYNARLQQYDGFLFHGQPMPQDLVNGQNNVVQYYNAHPYEQSFFVLNESDGQQAFIPPHFHSMSLPGPPPPPAVDGRGGVVIPWVFINFGWARLNLQTHLIDDIFVPPRQGNADETLNVSVGGNKWYIFHMEEGNAQWTGIFDQNTRQATTFSHEKVDRRWWQLTDSTENGNNAVAIANGYFYHIVFHQIAAWKGQ